MSFLSRMFGGDADPKADHLADVPSFTVDGVTFRCWVTEQGQRYEWRSTDGRCFAGRNVGSATCWASVDRRMIGESYVTTRDLMTRREISSLRHAIIAAVGAAKRRAA